jgi:hypothetical protein
VPGALLASCWAQGESVDFFRGISHPVHGERAEVRLPLPVLDRIHVSRIWRIASNQLLKKNMNHNDKKWIALTEDVLTFGINTINSVSVDSNNGLQVLTSILFRRVVFGLEAVSLLVKHKLLTEARLQRRGMLEALFTLGALWKQPQTVSDFINNDIHRMIKLYKNIKYTSKKFKDFHLGGISKVEIEKILINLKNKKTGQYLSIKSLSQKAELYDLFLSDYAILSESAHHLAKDLERHVSVDKKNNILGFLVEDETTTAKDILFPAIDHTLMALDAISDIFAINISSDINQFSERVNELRKSSS